MEISPAVILSGKYAAEVRKPESIQILRTVKRAHKFVFGKRTTMSLDFHRNLACWLSKLLRHSRELQEEGGAVEIVLLKRHVFKQFLQKS